MNIFSLDKENLKAHCDTLGFKPFQCSQIFRGLYKRGLFSFDEMTDLSKINRNILKSNFNIIRPQISKAQRSTDGTQKWLFKFSDSNEAEVVHIPESTRGTLCISSQIGCTLTCKFCHTGTQRLVRNLESSEILGQVLVAFDLFDDWKSRLRPTDQNSALHVTNIVLMGMGEPLYNYENVKKALLLLMDPEGIAFSKRRITLSTSGVVPFIERCGKELGVNLAISLHAANDKLRDHLMPLNKKYPLRDLIHACKNYPALERGRRITFEYVMLKDVNDSDADARELIRLIQGIPSKINLIPFNSWPGSQFECSTQKRIQSFSKIIQDAGYMSLLREPRGQDILAACGQLKSESERTRRTLETLN